jgi:hypothetical protein
LRRPHNVISLRKMLPRTRLRRVSESQASCIDDAIIPYERHRHLGGLPNLGTIKENTSITLHKKINAKSYSHTQATN